MNDRKQKMIARIHILANQLFRCGHCGAFINQATSCFNCSAVSDISPLSDEDYREILVYLVGKTSCKEMDEKELIKVGFFFNRASKGFEVLSNNRSTKEGMIAVIFSRADVIMGASSRYRIRSYCEKKFGTADLMDLTLQQLRSVNGFLTMVSKQNANK